MTPDHDPSPIEPTGSPPPAPVSARCVARDSELGDGLERCSQCGSLQGTHRCRYCRLRIPPDAAVCTHCDRTQRWGWLRLSNQGLALLISLISVTTAAAAILPKAIHKSHTEFVHMPVDRSGSGESNNLYVLGTNDGNRASTTVKALTYYDSGEPCYRFEIMVLGADGSWSSPPSPHHVVNEPGRAALTRLHLPDANETTETSGPECQELKKSSHHVGFFVAEFGKSSVTTRTVEIPTEELAGYWEFFRKELEKK